MKKLIPLMIGLGLVLGTTASVFARPGDPQDTSKKKKSKKKSDTTKLVGSSVHSN